MRYGPEGGAGRGWLGTKTIKIPEKTD